MMQQILKKLYGYETMDRETAATLLLEITSGHCKEVQVAAFLSIFLMRPITVEELKGFRDAMMSTCITVNFSGIETMDIVGTGGDGKNTFNISTAAAMVVAGAGIKVAKHGNFGISSVSGSSDVLDYLGYRFTSDSTILNRQLETAHICFLHAPLFHPAMKQVAVVRKNLGLRTFFNLLGPVINPATPSIQLLGVSHISLLRLYQYLYQSTKHQYSIVCSLDGYDEVSLTAPFKIIQPGTEQILYPGDIGMQTVLPKDLDAGASVKDAAAILVRILTGKGTEAQKQVVIANSGFAIHGARPEHNLADCFDMARESLQSGKAYRVLQKLLNNNT